jgi:preprotein translocase subunit SecA
MFTRILNKIAGDYNAKQLKLIEPILKDIDRHYQSYQEFSDEQIVQKTLEFKTRIHQWETIDQLLPEAFALVKYACQKLCGKEIIVRWSTQTRNMIPYDVQLIGGIVLHRGKIAEMKTGEGKTLVAAFPLYLNALTGRGAHLVTVNDYLAQRDAEQMSYLYNFLGLSVWCVHKGISPQNRKPQYEKDITYIENSELWFDYLRDNLVKQKAQRSLIWRPLHFAIVDEADSILIDEARTPLIISQPSDEATDKYIKYGDLIKKLIPCSTTKKKPKWFLKELLDDEKKEIAKEDGDFYIDEKHKTATLSSVGIAKLETILWVENLYKDLWYDEIHHIENALKAINCYIIDKDYIVRNGEVLIVDEHTGRTMPGRRYSEWLHQAIEAKEWLAIQKESKTLATITYQNFFKIYHKIAGMTGTATTEWEEFEKIYTLEVLSIPTNKTCIRVDKHDKVYFNQKAKRNNLCQTIKFYHDIWVPQLIWTSSIYTSEFASDLLRKMSIQHYVLNAKYHEQEAQIVSNAGKYWSVVVATNMAGRGTDIKLEEWLNEKIADNYIKRIHKAIQWDTFTNSKPVSLILKTYSTVEHELIMSKLDMQNIVVWLQTWHKSWINHYATITIKNQDSSAELIYADIHFGLMIIGTEKHESRRIDNQLRGRSGRQWDPGMSQFFVALDDEIMRKMWWEKIQSIAGMLLSKSDIESLELTQTQFTSSIERAQKQMEAYHFGIRKHLFDYDNVINKQRQKIYAIRDQLLGVRSWTNIHWDITKVLILHGFDGHADSGWKWRLKTELEKHTIEVRAPQLVNSNQPVLEEQLQQIMDLYGDRIDEHTAIVWHSLGWLLAQHIVLAMSKKSKKIWLLIAVAPAYHTISNIWDTVITDWTSPDWVTTHAYEKIHAYENHIVNPWEVTKAVQLYQVYLSKTDQYIPFEEAYRYFASQYNRIQIQVFDDMKHFNHSAGIDILPQALDAILSYQINTNDIVSEIKWFIMDVVSSLVTKYNVLGMDIRDLIETIDQDFGIKLDTTNMSDIAIKTIENKIVTQLELLREHKIVGQDLIRLTEYFTNVYITTIDKYWIDHIDEMQYLREKVWLYGYAQMDPLIIYKQESYEKFETLMYNIKSETLGIIYRTDFVDTPQVQWLNIDTNSLKMSWGDGITTESLGDIVKFAQQIQQDTQKGLIWPWAKASVLSDNLQVMDLDTASKFEKQVIIPENRKTRPNDICPCGSGKKYKKCHWK